MSVFFSRRTLGVPSGAANRFGQNGNRQTNHKQVKPVTHGAPPIDAVRYVGIGLILASSAYLSTLVHATTDGHRLGVCARIVGMR